MEKITRLNLLKLNSNSLNRTKLLILLIVTLVIISCETVKEKTKKSINAGGEVVGKTATEFFEGVSEGVDKTLQCEITLSQFLKDSGLTTGKFSIDSDTISGKNNLLILYLIFDKDFSKTILVKAFDKTGLEIGRTKLKIDGKAGDAKYYDLAFDKRTHIEVKSKFSIE
jgi:hypothetical protein